MMDKPFSYIVEDYFLRNNLYPIIFSYKSTHISSEKLDEIQDTLFNHFQNKLGIEVEMTEILDDEYWPGVLIIISQEEQLDVDMNLQNLQLYYDLIPKVNSSTGYWTGHSAYSASNLESLGKQYFKNNY